MISFDLSEHKIHHIHLIGIGGISMSAIAEVLLNHGYRVSGSDIKQSNIVDKLKRHGAEIFIGHRAENIQNPDLVVYSAAIKSINPERVRAEELNIPQVDRAEMLGQIMKKYEKAIAVAGSHGKTTTTSLVSLLLEYADLDPTILVGGELDDIGGNIKIGKSQHFITEACEYVESFLKLFPFIGIILNIDEDHLDYYRDLDHIKEAFRSFVKLIPQEGFLVACNDDSNVREVYGVGNCNVITYGINIPSDFMAKDIIFDREGHPMFKVTYRGEDFGDFHLSIPGVHNVYNALASIATSHILGIDTGKIAENLKRYHGIHRRFDILGDVKGAKIVDDYAHHPVEIKATLEAAKQYPHKKIWAIFQPHTYSRTKALLKEFADAFGSADYIIITDIYAAREPEDCEVSSKKLVSLMDPKLGARYMEDFEEIVDYVYENIQPGDLVLTMGAGDVYKIGEMLLNKFQ
ncbi:UDP-N-acetylmuramate--L-alanine ligase [Natronincola ferrireducens]|uniref:UDP-N-acetylmuramate--L-alanine ligase n=1 Tax=Natronincola ferrireducens TaxID=393762 RepID=A0A1G8WWX4_9FIRM|nr:UDP-N-acetylmuramate--L-alanine ligase [Natronincola ferrireducens]SDJ82898.1 UDP-N-acetylmuramate--L-alanine ligase [Natronincola ferrireducens]